MRVVFGAVAVGIVSIWGTCVSAATTYRFSNEEAELQMARFADCIVADRTDLARQLLSTALQSPEQEALVEKNFHGENMCLGGMGRVDLRFRGTLPIVGDIAVSFIRGRYARYDLATEVTGTPAIAPRNGLEVFGQCVVLAAPGGAVQLVRSELGSKAEGDAMDALTPTLTACTPAGRTYRMSRATVRRLAALTLYRYAVQAEARVPAH